MSDTIFDDIETESEGLLEIYVRMNSDLEKDYCFVISVNDTFNDLQRIFDALPLALRPSVLYKLKPKAFAVSTAPGYLTEDGALLFQYDCDANKWIKTVKQDSKISDNVWPGQLILPVWEFDHFNFYSILFVLLGWLYTDLPDAVSPTPGICLTNQISRFLSYMAQRFLDDPSLAESILSEVETPSTLIAQIMFFGFHVLKVVMIFLILYAGVFNPYHIRIPGITQPKEIANVTKEELIKIGWTGSKRSTLDEYREYYREYRIAKAGGLVKASQAGLLKKLGQLGTFLGEGEGFNTPIGAVSTLKQLKEEKKFTMSFEFLALVGSIFEKSLATTKDINKTIKDFRKYGLLVSNEEVDLIVQKRKALGDGNILGEFVFEDKKDI